MKCLDCGTGKPVNRVADVEGEVRGERFTVASKALVCDRCGYQAMEGEDVQEFMRALGDAYRRAHRLLTSAEIRSRRGALGMSQSEFSVYLGVGVASIKRWELGAIQDVAIDRYLRLKTDPEEAQLGADDVAARMGGKSKAQSFSHVVTFKLKTSQVTFTAVDDAESSTNKQVRQWVPVGLNWDTTKSSEQAYRA